MATLEYFTIEELLQKKAILEMQDGNHGEQHPRQSDFVDKGIPFLTATHVFDNQVFLNLAPRISPDNSKKLRIGWIQPNDVLLSHNATVGRVGVVPQFEGKAVIGTSLTYYRLNPKWFSPEFFALVLNSQEFQSQLEQIMKQTTRNQVPITRQRELIVPVLPISEQKRIAAIAQKADRLRRTRRYALQLSDTYLQSVFVEMFGDPATNPKNWEIIQLGNLLETPPQNGLYVPKENYEHGSSNNGVEMVHMSDLFYEIVNRGNLKRVKLSPADTQKYLIDQNDLLVARRSLVYEGAAKPCRLPESKEPLVFESSIIRIRVNKFKLLPVYLYYYLSNERARFAHVLRYVTESTISGINQSGLNSIEIIKPPLPLQEKFAQIVQKFERFRTQQREGDRQAEHLFQTLLHRAFRGELTPQDANDEPASVLLEQIGVEQAKAEAEAKAATQAIGDAAEYLGTKAKQQDTEPIQLTIPGIE